MRQLYFKDIIMPDEGILQLLMKGRVRELKHSCAVDIQDWKCKTDICRRSNEEKPVVMYGVHEEGYCFVINPVKLAELTGLDSGYWENVLDVVIERYKEEPIELFDEIMRELDYSRRYVRNEL